MTQNSEAWSEQSIYLLRTTQQHHVQLSLMADHKANMLIGAAFVVFSIAVSQSANAGSISLYLLALAISSAISALLAAMAVIPNIGAVPTAATDRGNLLFFGAFRQMEEDEYITALSAQMRTDDAVYRAMLRDVYQMGQVLAKKKYRYLRWSYSIFIAGILLTVALFALENLGAF
ncbi:MAG: Pycsar system effector family protein [Pseudomonadota bacterium]